MALAVSCGSQEGGNKVSVNPASVLEQETSLATFCPASFEEWVNWFVESSDDATSACDEFDVSVVFEGEDVDDVKDGNMDDGDCATIGRSESDEEIDDDGEERDDTIWLLFDCDSFVTNELDTESELPLEIGWTGADSVESGRRFVSKC